MTKKDRFTIQGGLIVGEGPRRQAYFGDCLTTPAAIPAERCGYEGAFSDTADQETLSFVDGMLAKNSALLPLSILRITTMSHFQILCLVYSLLIHS